MSHDKSPALFETSPIVKSVPHIGQHNYHNNHNVILRYFDKIIEAYI